MEAHPQLIGYLTQINQPNRVMTLYRWPNRLNYFATHEYHPGIKLRPHIQGRPLKDREEVKVPGYIYPFKQDLTGGPGL